MAALPYRPGCLEEHPAGDARPSAAEVDTRAETPPPASQGVDPEARRIDAEVTAAQPGTEGAAVSIEFNGSGIRKWR